MFEVNESFLADEHPIVLLRPHLTFPYAWAGHIPFAYLVVDLLRPRLLVELGSDSGNSYLAFCQAIQELGCETRSVAIDCWEGDEHARHYGSEIYEALRSYHDPRYGAFSRLFRSYFDDAVATFEDGSIDLLHIDGLHSYAAVSHDFETWLPKLSDRAVVLLHDTEVRERGFGVYQFLDELSKRYPTFNFKHSNGLGVVAVGRDVPLAFEQFLNYAHASPATVRGYFEALARNIIQPDGTNPAAADVVEVDLVSSLYYRSEEETFSDQRVSTRRVNGEEGDYTLRFFLDEGVRPDYIRFDPAEVPGVFEIRRVALGLPEGALVELNDLDARLGHVSGELLPERAPRVGLVGSDSDPYIELAVADVTKKLPSEGATVVEVALRILVTLRDPRLWKLASAQLESLGSLRRAAQNQIDVRALSRQIHQMVAASQLREEMLSAQAKAARDALEATNAREVELRRQLEAIQASKKQAMAEIQAASLREAELQQRQLELTAATVELEARNNAMTEVRDQLVSELSDIKSSTAWRIVTRVRSVLARLTPGTRLVLRRGTKALWWAITPWRLPARLESRRAALAPFAAQNRGSSRAIPRRQLRRGHRLEARAIRGLTALATPNQEPIRWRTHGNDPHFHLISASTGELCKASGGWYLLSVAIEACGDPLESPRLYIDYGYGFNEADAISLKRMQSATGILGLLRFTHAVHALRFDPTDRESEFILGEISLTRMSRASAAMSMYKALIRREGSRVAVSAVAAAEFRRGGTGAVGEWLYGNYACEPDSKVEYNDWVKRFEALAPEQRIRLAGHARNLPQRPMISLLMPVYNTPEIWLRRCLDSVLQQAYPYWELCIADDASTAPHVREVLQQYAANDTRIKVVYREVNGHISEASNSALTLVTGDWIALLDHDDELPPHALFMVAKTIGEKPQTRLIYSDEDKIDANGRRFDPYFKPDWNPDLFLSQNMLSHLGVYHADLVRAVGGFRRGYEGSQDYDLALRCVEQLHGDQIAHIPYVLYHWRAIEGSTALAKGEKDYASLAGARALEDHLSRTGAKDATVHITGHGYRVKRELTKESEPSVSLIIPTRDRVELLRMCVNSILEKTSYANYEIVIVDNQSAEPETHAFFEHLRDVPRVRVLSYDAPFNYSRMNNVAVASCDSGIIGLINNDIEVITPDWLTEMVSQAIRPEVGVVGAMLYYPNDTVQHAGVIVGLGGVANHAYAGQPRGTIGQMGRAGLLQEFSAVTAACMLIRRELFTAVGGLDERLQVAFNDVDFCLRVRQSGYRVLWTPYAELYHHESASRGSEDTPEKRARFAGEVALMRRRWAAELAADPAYNPNLALTGTDFALADEPRLPRLADLAAAGQPSTFDKDRTAC